MIASTAQNVIQGIMICWGSIKLSMDVRTINRKKTGKRVPGLQRL